MADSIDALLERYLNLLDQYTHLREALNAAQSSMYQNLARANFSAERGVRYGQDFYDQRMQAVRRLSAKVSDLGVPQFDTGLEESRLDAGQLEAQSQAEPAGAEDNQEDAGVNAGSRSTDEDQKPKRPSDPLRWFGLLTPAPLRSAQGQAVQAVEEIIPQLATVKAEMTEVEIQVRRARKKRAKTEAAARKAPGIDQGEDNKLTA